ncbi:MAG: hypothetical protein HY538_07860 [Deltaproteobacteria bacterium]|nr:hypothetical protein [Deltaproteobacteria bacterium]
MKSRIKRIIAREGLIIISLAILATVCIFLSDWQSAHISKPIVISQRELQPILDLVKRIDKKHIICPSGYKIEFESSPDNQDIYWACQNAKSDGSVNDLSKMSDKELLDLAEIPIEERPLVQRIDFSAWGMSFLLVVYPAYLLFRFIFWAIRTLRQKG